MRISDWSSDVCSSDLGRWFALAALGSGLRPSGFGVRRGEAVLRLIRLTHHGPPPPNQWSRSLAQPVGRWFALAALGSGLRPSGFGVRRGEAVLRLIRLTHHGPPSTRRIRGTPCQRKLCVLGDSLLPWDCLNSRSRS